jgi:NAD-dependent SIR2 family protein deacetylase
MPWRCPACHTQIHHSELEERPTSGHTYRCHVCRLDLALDSDTQKLTVAPFRDDYDPRSKPTK